MTYVILPISAGRWQHANTQQPMGVVGLVIIHVNGPAPNHDTPSDTTDNISEVRQLKETTPDLGKPGLVDPVPDVEDLFLDLLLAGVISTQHTVQLNIQTHIHSKLHSTFTIIIIFIRTKSTNTEKQLTQQYRL